MTTTKNYKLTLGIIFGAIAFIGLAYFGILNYQNAQGSSAASNAVDLIGTRVGTTTTGVAFAPFSGTTTFRTYIGGETDTVTLTLRSVGASTTNGVLNMNILASNDASCFATTTTAGGTVPNQVVTADINWYDALPYIKGATGATALANATGTIQWLMSGSQGKQLVFTDLVASCLAVEARGASTSVLAQVRTKQR